MEKFDLEAAKKGAAVCLRNGTPAKILDFQFRLTDRYMILYKYHDIGIGAEIQMFADQTGRCANICIDSDQREYDLFMAPIYAYACIYKDPMTGVLSTNYINQTFEEAKANQLPTTENREFFCHARIDMFFKE